MNIRSTIKELTTLLGPPKERAEFGSLKPYAWLVRGLVEKGYGVTESVRVVLQQSDVGNSEKTFRSTRAAYYKIRDKTWPAESAQPEVEEGFE